MSDEKSKSKTEAKSETKSGALESGMYECEHLKGLRKGEKDIYHSSTAETLQNKGFVKVVKKIKEYIPATMKK